MKGKLILSEDLEEDIIMDDGQVSMDTNNILRNVITSLIQSEWQSIDLYNNISVSVEDESIINTIKDILNDKYIHIGQLENILQKFEPAADNLGDVEVEQELDDVQVPEDELTTESLKEDYFAANPLTNVVLGIYIDPHNKAGTYHYELDPLKKVYTKVVPERILGYKYKIDTHPFNTMDELEEYAKEMIGSGEYKEISNDEYIAHWKDRAANRDEEGAL